MNLNFKKNNLLIIMLLIFVILSCIVFINMSNIKEAFTNVNNNNRRYFVDIGGNDTSYNVYILNPVLAKYKLSTLPSSGLQNIPTLNITSGNPYSYRFHRENNMLITYYNC